MTDVEPIRPLAWYAMALGRDDFGRVLRGELAPEHCWLAHLHRKFGPCWCWRETPVQVLRYLHDSPPAVLGWDWYQDYKRHAVPLGKIPHAAEAAEWRAGVWVLVAYGLVEDLGHLTKAEAPRAYQVPIDCHHGGSFHVSTSAVQTHVFAPTELGVEVRTWWREHDLEGRLRARCPVCECWKDLCAC